MFNFHQAAQLSTLLQVVFFLHGSDFYVVHKTDSVSSFMTAIAASTGPACARKRGDSHESSADFSDLDSSGGSDDEGRSLHFSSGDL